MRRFIRKLWLVCAVIAAAACQASTTPSATESFAASTRVAEPTIAPTMAASPNPEGVDSPSCDPVEAMFASMFVGLTRAALANAEIEPEEFFAALATNRETLKRYLEALGIPVDDAQLDALMSDSLAQELLRQHLDQGAMPWADACGAAAGNLSGL